MASRGNLPAGPKLNAVVSIVETERGVSLAIHLSLIHSPLPHLPHFSSTPLIIHPFGLFSLYSCPNRLFHLHRYFTGPNLQCTLPSVPLISPSPILPACGVGNAQVPNAVAANVCVNITFTLVVVPPCTSNFGTFITVGYCVAMGAGAAPPPRAAFWATDTGRRPRKTETMRLWRCMLEICGMRLEESRQMAGFGDCCSMAWLGSLDPLLRCFDRLFLARTQCVSLIVP
jgi:hypothetical protein